jgi:hypothetical protein
LLEATATGGGNADAIRWLLGRIRSQDASIQRLLEAKATVSDAVVLHAVSGRLWRHEQTLRVLLAAGGNPNARSKQTIGEDSTALMAAADCTWDRDPAKAVALGALLLKARANPNTLNARGESAVYIAASRTGAGLGFVELLLSARADARARHTSRGDTALHGAAKRCCRRTCALLLRADSSGIGFVDGANLRAIDVAKFAKYELSRRAAAHQSPFDHEFDAAAAPKQLASAWAAAVGTVQLLRDWTGAEAFAVGSRNSWRTSYAAALPPLQQTHAQQEHKQQAKKQHEHEQEQQQKPMSQQQQQQQQHPQEQRQTYCWARSPLFDVHLIEEITSFLM